MTDWYTTDGKIDPARFSTWQHVNDFRQHEHDFWSTLASENHGPGANTVAERMGAALNKLRPAHQSLRNNGQGFAAGLNSMKSLLEGEGVGLPSTIFADPEVQDVERTVSRGAAIFFAGFQRGIVSLADARSRDDLLGAFWQVAPGLHKTTELASLLSKERDSTRRTLRSEVDRLRRADAARADEWEGKLQEAYAAYVGWARRRSTRWGRLTRSWEGRHEDSEKRIRSVEETYREHMGLKAPVEYWTAKARQHRISERWALGWVIAFFVITLPAMAYVFNETGVSLIRQALAPRPEGAAAFPNAIFLIASAGLASCAGLVFWAGRLLTKLYLSQHHLRQDAEERATMTQTYLALIENSAASTDDRQVILNALFRNTPDGIVKEEGGLDPSIAAALGKYLAKA